MSAYDVVVVGGGVIGTSCAFHLAEKGFDVAIVEMGDLAHGTSSHCDACAMLTDKKPGSDAALGYASINRFKELAEQFSYEFDFVQRGSLYICESDQELAVAASYVKSMQDEGYPVRMMDQYEMSQKEPYLATDLAGGFWCDARSFMNPYKLCYAFVEEGKKRGTLEALTYTKVTGIRLDDKNSVSGVETDRGFLATRKVVNCGGIWAPEIGYMVGIDIPIQPRKGVILISERSYTIVHQKTQEFGYMLTKFDDINFVRNVPLSVEKYNVAFTLEPTAHDNFILGSSRNLAGYDIHTEIEVVNAIAKRGIRFYPILREFNCIRAYAGLRPFVTDHFPIISDVKRVPGYYIAAGHEGDGIAMSPMTGKLITQMISGELLEMDISAFDYSRFEVNSH